MTSLGQMRKGGRQRLPVDDAQAVQVLDGENQLGGVESENRENMRARARDTVEERPWAAEANARATLPGPGCGFKKHSFAVQVGEELAP